MDITMKSLTPFMGIKNEFPVGYMSLTASHLNGIIAQPTDSN